MDSTPQSADGTLVIIVCRAKHLPNRRKLDKQSPYVTLRLGTVAKKTPSHFRAGQTPDWTHEIRFDLSRDRKPILKLDVLDETKNDPTPIGTCDIDCSVIFLPDNQRDGKYIYDKWYELKLNGRRAGNIYLEMTFYPSAPVLPPKLYEDVAFEGASQEFRSSTSSHKSLPPPPQHPSMSRQPSIIDDIFVAGDAQKKLFFRRSDKSDTPLTSSASSKEDEVFVDSPEKKGIHNRLNKLKSKFQSKQPITSLWSPEEKQRQEMGLVSPINIEEFDNLDELERDLHFRSPGSHSPGRDSPGGDILVGAFGSPTGFQVEDMPPSPPPHSDYSSFKKPSRKPPPQSPVLKLNFGSTSIPYSADTIGLEDDDAMPTKVYLMDKPIKSLSHSSLPNPPEPKPLDEIDPKYYAPTPDQHFRNSRQEYPRRALDLRTSETGYLGNGQWDQKFSPSIFDKVPNDKPAVPPKIPSGLTEQEYYVIEKENYIRDINGHRT